MSWKSGRLDPVLTDAEETAGRVIGHALATLNGLTVKNSERVAAMCERVQRQR